MKKKEKSIILIVDDKSANILALESLLIAEDRTIIQATNGNEALKILLNKNVDLIILDVQMPEMDGFEVANILKSNKKTKDIPIIFASAEKKEHHSMMKGFEEGAVDYLFKPLDPEIARAKVAVLLKLQLQRKELQEKNNSLEKSALLINNSADIIGIVDATTFKIEEINNAFTDILGYGPEETRGTALLFFLGNEDRTIVQDLARQNKEQLNFETRVHCKDREVKWLQWRVVVKGGKWFVNARDITEIKLVETIRNYLATVVKQSNDAIYIHDSEGKIIAWNEGAERMYGYTEAEALKMKLWNMIPEYMQLETEELVNEVFDGKKIFDYESRRITKHGKLIDVLLSATVITDPDHGKKSIAINERNISEQKIADQKILQLHDELQNNIHQLESSNKELESFSYSISHDLRSPLRAIDGFTRILHEDYNNKFDEEGKRLLSVVQYNAKKMGHLIDDLLAFSRLGRKSIQKSTVNIRELAEHTWMEIGKTQEHNAQLIISGDLHAAQADYALLNQVFVNLLSNAIKYSSRTEKPVVELTSHISEHEIVYALHDNGVGFDMKYIDKLFGVFQRLHDAKEFEGTGVGLAIVQRIINKHGGRVWAESLQGEGATFYFSLPVNGHHQT